MKKIIKLIYVILPAACLVFFINSCRKSDQQAKSKFIKPDNKEIILVPKEPGFVYQYEASHVNDCLRNGLT